MADQRQFEILALDYEMAREDERTFQNIQAVVVGLTIALFAAVATIVSDACELKSADERLQQPDCKHIPKLFLAGAPSIPLATLAFLQLLGVVSALRSYYLRAVERELQRYTTSNLSALREIGPIPPVSYMGIMTEVTTMRRGRAGYRVLSILIMLIALGFFGGLAWYIAIRVGGAYEKAMFAFYGTAFALLVADVWAATLGARTTFVRIADKFVARQSGSHLVQRAGAEGRSLTSYLILPRPDDCAKWLFIPGVFVMASWSTGGPFYWGRMFLTLLIVEFLVYSARYQWNDIRGVEEDSRHPEADARRRLPFMRDDSQRRVVVYSSLAVGAARICAAVLLGWAVGAVLPVSILIATIFGIAIIYETIRAVEVRHYVEERPQRAQYVVAASLWLLVGLGYVVRFCAGLDAAGVLALGPLIPPGVVYAFSFGIMFVLLTWVLEAASYCRGGGNYWYVVNDRSFRSKPHLAVLLSFLAHPQVHFEVRRDAPTFGNRRSVRVLAPADAAKLWSPWNLAYLAASISGAFLGAHLSGDDLPSLGIVALSAVSAAVVMRIDLGDAWRKGVIGFLVAVLGMVGIAAIDTRFDSNRVVLLTLPWVIVAGTYVGFRLQSYHSLKGLLDGLTKLGDVIAKGLARIVVGKKTWDGIKRD